MQSTGLGGSLGKAGRSRRARVRTPGPWHMVPAVFTGNIFEQVVSDENRHDGDAFETRVSAQTGARLRGSAACDVAGMNCRGVAQKPKRVPMMADLPRLVAVRGKATD
jgi:hypothetical protein